MNKSELKAERKEVAPTGGIRGLTRYMSLSGEITLLIIVLIGAAAVYFVNPAFGSLYNLQVVARSWSVFAILAIAETMVIITAGIDLSPGSIVALTGVVLAIMLRDGFNFALATVLALALGALIGLWHGIAVTKIGVSPFIITLGTLSIARGVAVTITKGIPVRDLPDAYLWIGRGYLFGTIPMPLVVSLVIVAYGVFILNYTPIGRYMRAIGGNKEAARLAGVPVDRVLIFVYIQATCLFAIGGILLMARLGQGFPAVALGYEFRAITAAVIGGTSLFGGVGSILGSALGAALMAVVDDAIILAKISPFITDIVMGFAIVLAVLIDVVRQKRAHR